MAERNTPARLQSGSVTASIWTNKGEDGEVSHSTEFSRNYKDGDGNFQRTTKMRRQDLLDLSVLAQDAHRHVDSEQRAHRKRKQKP